MKCSPSQLFQWIIVFIIGPTWLLIFIVNIVWGPTPPVRWTPLVPRRLDQRLGPYRFFPRNRTVPTVAVEFRKPKTARTTSVLPPSRGYGTRTDISVTRTRLFILPRTHTPRSSAGSAAGHEIWNSKYPNTRVRVARVDRRREHHRHRGNVRRGVAVTVSRGRCVSRRRRRYAAGGRMGGLVRADGGAGQTLHYWFGAAARRCAHSTVPV
jgi:hypothetical protein